MAQQVLIVEDEPHIVESLSFLLERAGFTVKCVMDGESALKALRRAPPSVLVLDVMLPKRNGFEVLKAVKDDTALDAIRVLMLTAKGQAQDRDTAMALGADAFITKPYSNREVVDCVQRLASGGDGSGPA